MQDKHYDQLEGIPAASVLYKKFIKYDQLNLIVSKEFQGCQDKIVNVYIDLYAMLITLYRCQSITGAIDISSCIVNMAIHYRNYFLKYGVYTNIFLIYSPTMGLTNLRHLPNYNSSYINRMVKNKQVYNAVNENLALLGTIVPYLPDIFLKIGTAETTVIAYDIMLKLQSKGVIFPSVFVTTSQYAFQLPAKYKRCVLFIKKTDNNNDDISYGVDALDCLDYYIKETKNKSDITIPKRNDWISAYMSLAGIPKRNVTSLFNFKIALEILNSLSSSYDAVTPEALFEHISRKYPDHRISLQELVERFRCIDLDYQLEEYRTLPESKETAFLNQLNDFDELVHLNDIYFKSNPMVLDKL